MVRCKSVIEFGTSKILCLMDYAGGRDDVFAGKSCVRYEGIVDGNWVNRRGVIQALEKAVEDCEELCSKQITKAIIGVPACFCHQVMGKSSANFNNRRLLKEDVDALIKEGRPEETDGYTLIDERPIYFDDCAGTETLDAPIGHRIRRLYVFSSYTYIRNSHLDFIEDMLSQLNITAERYVLDQHALAMHSIPDRDRDNTAILVDVGYNITSVSCIIGSAVATIVHFNGGGSYISNALEKKLNVSSIMAENIKRNHIFDIQPLMDGRLYAKDETGKMHELNQYKVNSVINLHTDKLIATISRIISNFAANRFCDESTPVYLSGGGLAIRDIESYMSSRLNRKVTLVRSSGRTSLSPIYNVAVSLLDNRLNWVYDSDIVYDEDINTKHKFLDFLDRYWR